MEDVDGVYDFTILAHLEIYELPGSIATPSWHAEDLKGVHQGTLEV